MIVTHITKQVDTSSNLVTFLVYQSDRLVRTFGIFFSFIVMIILLHVFVLHLFFSLNSSFCKNIISNICPSFTTSSPRPYLWFTHHHHWL